MGETDRTGSVITFKPDPEMFDTITFSYETIHTRMRQQAFLNAGVRILTFDKRPEQEMSDEMCYEGGIREYVTWLNQNKTAVHEDVIYMAGQKDDSMVEVAMQYNDGYAENIVSFANDVRTPEGGMHEEGFKRALTNALNAYGKKANILKNDDKVSGEDCREGLTCVIAVKLTEAQFEGQTKAKLGNASIRTLTMSVVSEKLEEYLEENPKAARLILDKAMMASRAQLIQVELLPDARAKAQDQRIELVISIDFIRPRLLHVEHLPPHGEDRLKAAVPALDGGARSGVALDRRERRRSPSGGRPPWSPGRCPTSCKTATSGTRSSASSTSSRATPLRAPPSRAGTAAFRRSSPCKTWSAATASSRVIRRRVRFSGSMVVSQSSWASISPKPLKRLISTFTLGPKSAPWRRKTPPSGKN